MQYMVYWQDNARKVHMRIVAADSHKEAYAIVAATLPFGCIVTHVYVFDEALMR